MDKGDKTMKAEDWIKVEDRLPEAVDGWDFSKACGGNGSNVWAVCNKRAQSYKGKFFVYKDEWLIKEGYFPKEYLV